MEATHQLVAMAMSKMEGKRRRTHRKCQKSRKNGGEGKRKNAANPGNDETESLKTENEKESEVEIPLGNFEKSRQASVEDWETSNDEES